MAAVLVASLCSVSGCGSTATSQGASAGAIVGGLTDGWGGAATGALVGAGVGYLVDDSADKQAAREQKEREVAALERASVTGNPSTAYRPDPANPLVGSTWRAISIEGNVEGLPKYHALTSTFASNTQLVSLVVFDGGKSVTYNESYGIVDDVIFVSGVDPETGESYATSLKFAFVNDQLMISGQTIQLVLERVQGS